MVAAISRYGVRVIPNTQQIIEDCQRRNALVDGPELRQFEASFCDFLGGGYASSASFGRMAFYYILQALDFPIGSEIVFPALTFWVVPEMARILGLKPVFADIDPLTFNLDPGSFLRVLSPWTRAVVPTHLFGLPCDMEPILKIAHDHGLKVIEDCAHSLGARYSGKMTGTFGDAAFYSFQTLKPLNTYGGGMAFTRDKSLATQVAALATAEPPPQPSHLMNQLLKGRMQRIFTRPEIFSFSGFPILWAASWIKARPDVYLWESIRALNPIPASYRLRYSNVQAALGLAGLEHLPEWNSAVRANADFMNSTLGRVDGVTLPRVPPGRSHVYYQYCIYVPDRDALVRFCIQRGVDLETLHVDVCPNLTSLFGSAGLPFPNANRAASVVQVPIYSSLSPLHLDRISSCITRAVAHNCQSMRAREVPTR